MNLNLRIIILIAFVFSIGDIVSAQWTQTNGPYGGTVRCFAVNDTYLCAGTEGSGGGIFRSNDNGATWNPVNAGLTTDVTSTNVFSLIVSGMNLFAGIWGGGVFLSTNNGTNWSPVNSSFTHKFVNAIAVSLDGTSLFVASDGGVYRSIYNGISWAPWTAVNNGLTYTDVRALVISPGGTEIFAGTSGGVYRSTDNGANWNPLFTGMTHPHVNCLALSPDGTVLFVGTYIIASFLGSVYRSTYNGTDWSTWTEVNTGLPNSEVQTLLVSPTGADLFAGTYDGGIFHSSSGGTIWDSFNTGLSYNNVEGLMISLDGTKLFAGTYLGGVFRSTNNGANWSAWSETNNDLTHTDIRAFVKYSNGTGGTNLFAGTYGSGIFLSTDNGVNWYPRNTGLTTTLIKSLAVSPDGTYLFAGTEGGGVFRSTNDGTNWSSTSLTNSDIGALLVSSDGAGVMKLFAGGYYSTDNGTIWSEIIPGFNSTVESFIAISTNLLFAGTSGSGAFRSTNNGTSWSAVNNGLTSNDVYTFAVDATGANLFAGTFGGGVYLSTDNGSNWNSRNTGLTDDEVIALVVSNTNIFAGTRLRGVFLSTNNGEIWTPVNSGLNVGLTNTIVQSLLVSGMDIFAGTNGNGIFHVLQSTLPVEISVFNATPKGSGVELNWRTETEVNNYGFEIERRMIDESSGKWNTIGFIEGEGARNAPKEYSFTDKSLFSGRYAYRLKQIDRDGKFKYTQEVEVIIMPIPTDFILMQNFPNPFNPTTVISYQLPVNSYMTLKVFDILGREVATLINEEKTAGSHNEQWNAEGYSSGVYLVRMQGGKYSATKKIVLMK